MFSAEGPFYPKGFHSLSVDIHQIFEFVLSIIEFFHQFSNLESILSFRCDRFASLRDVSFLFSVRNENLKQLKAIKKQV